MQNHETHVTHGHGNFLNKSNKMVVFIRNNTYFMLNVMKKVSILEGKSDIYQFYMSKFRRQVAEAINLFTCRVP